MHFEDLLEEIGSFGRYQKLMSFVLIPFTTGIVALTFYTQIFVLTAPLHTCRLRPPQDGGDGGRQEVLPLPPLQEDFLTKVSGLLNATDVESEALQPYSCHQHDLRSPLTWQGRDEDWVRNLTSLDQVPPPTEACINGWDFDNGRMFPTYTSEQDYVCEDAWRPYLVATLFWVGNTIGSWVFGFVSDTYGRRPTLLLCHLIYGVAGVASVFVSDFYGFLFLRTMVGFSHHTVTHLPFVLVVEYCGLKSRTVPLLTVMATYTLASILTPLLAWLLWDWRHLALITSVPALLFVLLYRWIPESSSWLITRGKSDAARKQLERVAKVNGREVPYQMLGQLLADTGDGQNQPSTSQVTKGESDSKDVPLQDVRTTKEAAQSPTRSSIIHVFRYPYLRRNVLMVLLVWMLSCMCYYGHCQNTANLGSNLFLSYLLGAVVEIPSWSAPWLISRFGRKKPLIVAFLIAGIASLLYSVLPQDVTWVVLATALLGRASITAAYYITLQYGPEVFPTVVRGQGVALSETLGGVAIFLSPAIVFLGETHRTAPLLVFGGLSVIAGMATLLLPETGGVVLPQTLIQAELFSKTTQFAIPCCTSSKPQSHTTVKTDEKEGEIA